VLYSVDFHQITRNFATNSRQIKHNNNCQRPMHTPNNRSTKT
jgi:hypothetical protein